MSLCEDSYGTQKRLEFIREVIWHVQPKNVLDIGCGVGQVSYPLAEQFPNVYFHGVDCDEASIRCAREKYSLPNLSFGHESGTYGQEKYELIIASEVIEHVEAPDEFLLSLRHQLEDTGRLILTLPNGYGPFEFAAIAEALLKLVGLYSLLRKLKGFTLRQLPVAPVDPVTLAVSPHINFFSFSQITNLLAYCGFKIEQYSPRTFLCGFGFDQLMRGQRILSWNGRIANRLPPFATSDWMFLASPSRANRSGRRYERGLVARIRRQLYEKQCELR